MFAICSCRASSQSSLEYADTTSVSVTSTSATLSTVEILSLFYAYQTLDLSGIKVEFFPPDSVHPDARAAPKSITIENAKAKETTEQTSHEQVSADEQKTVNLSAQSSTDIAKGTRTDNNILRPADWVVFFSILSAIIIFLIFLIKSRK